VLFSLFITGTPKVRCEIRTKFNNQEQMGLLRSMPQQLILQSMQGNQHSWLDNTFCCCSSINRIVVVLVLEHDEFLEVQIQIDQRTNNIQLILGIALGNMNHQIRILEQMNQSFLVLWQLEDMRLMHHIEVVLVLEHERFLEFQIQIDQHTSSIQLMHGIALGKMNHQIRILEQMNQSFLVLWQLEHMGMQLMQLKRVKLEELKRIHQFLG